MQAVSLANFLKKYSNKAAAVVGSGIFCHLVWKKYQEEVKKRETHDQLQKYVNGRKRELLTGVDTDKRFPDSLGQYHLVSPDDQEIKEVHGAFDLLEIPKYLAKKILIFGMEYINYPEQEK